MPALRCRADRKHRAARRILVVFTALTALVVPSAAASLAASTGNITFTSTPVSPGNNTSPTWTFRSPGASALTCTLVAPDGSADAGVDCSSGRFTAALSGRPEGTWTMTINDGQGRASSSSYLLDVTPPPTPTVTGPTGPSRQTSGVFNLSDTESGVTWHCTVVGPTGTTQPSCSSGAWTTYFTTEGTYTGYISVLDAAGNESAPAVHTYVLDLTAPAAPTVTLDTAAHLPRNPTYTLAGETGGTWTCGLIDPAGASSAVSCSAGTLPLDLQGPDGLWSLTARQTDAAGNVGATTTTQYLLDSTAPLAPRLTGPTGPSRDSAPTFSLSGESGGTFTCAVTPPGGTPSSFACAAGSFTVNMSGPDGDYVVSAHQTDAAGNVGPDATATYSLDSATDAPIVRGPTGPSGDTSPVFSLSASKPGTFACTLTAPDGVTTSPPCSSGGQVTFDLSRPASDGTWQVSVVFIDSFGLASSPTTVDYTLDTQTPQAPTVSGPLGPHLARKPAYAIAGESGATFTCQLTGPRGVNLQLACDSADPLVLDLTGADGTYNLAVTQTDAAGHTSPATTRSYLLDTTPPAAPGVTGPTGPAPDTNPTFDLVGEPGGSWSCVVTDPTSATVPVSCAAGALTLDLTAGDGDYQLAVTQMDDSGNVSPTTIAPYTLTMPPSPSPTDSPSPSPTDSPSPSPTDSPSPSPTDSPSPSPSPAAVVPSDAPSPDASSSSSPSPSASPSPSRSPSPSVSPASVPAPIPPPFVGPVQPNPPFVGPVAPTAEPPLDPVIPPSSEPAAPMVTTRQDDVVTPIVTRAAPVVRTPPSHVAAIHYASSTHVARRADLRPTARLPLLHGRWRQTLRLAAETTQSGGPPVLLLVIAFAFLAAQDRIDRNDPKLALAPVHGHQELTFKPIDRGTP